MHTWDDLTNPCLDAGLLSQVGNVFSTLANDDTSIFGANQGTQREDVVIDWGR